jgi:hypothetical protein
LPFFFEKALEIKLCLYAFLFAFSLLLIMPFDFQLYMQKHEEGEWLQEGK